MRHAADQEIAMKFLALVGLGTVLATSAFAQAAPTRQDAQAARQAGHPSVHVYAAEYYEPSHGSPTIHPDHQLGSNRY
jgi:hypothetical protein